MKHHIFTVFDSAAELFNTPFFFRSKGEAMRWFIDCSGDESTPVGQHPKDYSLYYLGEFDDETSEFQESVKVAMMTGIEARASWEADNGPQIGNGPPVLAGSAS